MAGATDWPDLKGKVRPIAGAGHGTGGCQSGTAGPRRRYLRRNSVRTPMSEAFYQAHGVAEKRAGIVPLGRVAVPDDIADVVVYLASARAGYVNGEGICTDGRFGRVLMRLVPRPGFEK